MSEVKKCIATTKGGTPCKGTPLPGSDFCMAHQPKPEEPEAVELCGHINRHSNGVDGKPDNLACEKPLGHSGNHGAMHEELRSFGEGGGTEPKGFTWREWLDIAGTPVDQIKPDPSSIRSRRKEADDEWVPNQ